MRLHGQHLARELVLRTVRGYLETPLPDKALALSFHGWSGTGKNFVARILAENLYRDGQKSPCVRVFIATIHFPHSKYVDLYQVRPAVWGSLTMCVQAGPGLGEQPFFAWWHALQGHELVHLFHRLTGGSGCLGEGWRYRAPLPSCVLFSKY